MFLVEALNPREIYRTAVDTVSRASLNVRAPESSFDPEAIGLSFQELDGSLLSHEFTDLYLLPNLGSTSDYVIRSVLYHSEDHLNYDPYGFYDNERVQRVQGELARMGMSSRLYLPDEFSTGLVLLGSSNQSLQVKFGNHSWQDDGASVRQILQIGDPGSVARKAMLDLAIRRSSRESNPSIYLSMPDETVMPMTYELTDQDSFVNNLDFYCSAYTALLGALHSERGIKPRGERIILTTR